MRKIYLLFLLITLNNIFSFSHTFGEKIEGNYAGYHKKMADPSENYIPENKWRIYFTDQADTAKIRNIKLKQYFQNKVLNDINFLDEYPFMISSQTFADSATFFGIGAQQNCGVLVTIEPIIGNGLALMTCAVEHNENINAEPAYNFMITVYTGRIKKAIKDKEKVNMYTLFRHEMLHGMGLGHSENPNELMFYKHQNSDIPISTDAIMA